MNLNELNKLALKIDDSCEVEIPESGKDGETLQENLSDSLSLLEDCQDFLEVLIGESPKFLNNFMQKQARKLNVEIDSFLADYIWTDGDGETKVGKNCIDDEFIG